MRQGILLLIIFAIGFFLRAQETLSGNFLFLKDQGRDMLEVKSIVMDRKMTLIGPYTGLQAVFQGPLYYYLLAVPFAVFHGDPKGVMYLMLTVSMAGIAFGYLIGKTFFSKASGFAIAFLFAVSPSAAAAATFIWSPFFVLPVATMAYYFLLDYVRRGAHRSYMILACCAGLLTHFEMAFAVPFTITIFSICLFIAHKRAYRFSPLLFLSIIALFLSPLILFDFRHDHITVRSVMRLLVGGSQGLGGGELYTKILRDHFVRFLINLKSTFINSGFLADLSAFFYILGMIGYLIRGKSLLITVLLFFPLIIFTVFLFYPFQIWDWYVIGLFPIYLILGGVFLGMSWSKKYGRILVVFIAILLLQNAMIRLIRLYSTPDYGGTAKMRGKLDAIDFMYRDAGGRPFNVLVFTPVVLTDAYDYLLWWHGQRTYGYIPGKSLSGNVYLLIEPDPAKPWSYQGWLDTVIKKGTIVKTNELPSGFIVQQREI